MRFKVGQRVKAKSIEEMKQTGNNYDQYLLKKLEEFFLRKNIYYRKNNT